MKPVVANPSATFEQLLEGLEVLDDEGQVQNQIDQIIAKLQRKKRHIDSKTMEYFISMTGGQDPTQFIDDIQRRSPADAKNRLLANRELYKAQKELYPQYHLLALGSCLLKYRECQAEDIREQGGQF